jgi:hypothetical protein
MSDPFDAIDKVDGIAVPIDPMDLLQCESCQ